MPKFPIFAIALLSISAQAQTLTVTPDTACGAPGVGMVWSGPKKGQIEAREGKPGQRVDAAGYWSKGCKMPPDCAAKPLEKFGAARQCAPMISELPASYLGKRRDVVGVGKNVSDWRGLQTWECKAVDGGARWVPVSGYCR